MYLGKPSYSEGLLFVEVNLNSEIGQFDLSARVSEKKNLIGKEVQS